MKAWYIDALDGLGGLAFASHRESDLDGSDPGLRAEKIELPGKAWMIQAPDFEPQPVSSRAIGFAAARRGLQLRLSVDGESEVPFPSLVALVEFVRRAFLSGGGGDGPDGVVPPDGGPPPEPERGETEDFDRPGGVSEALQQYAAPLNEFVKAHLAAVASRSGAEETAVQTEALTPPTGSAPHPSPLTLLDDLIGAELARRWTGDGGSPEADIWAIAAQRYLLQARALAVPVDRMMELIWPNYGGWWEPYAIPFEDPLDVLASLPIPREVARTDEGGGSTFETWKSVKDLFFGLLANPALFTQTSYGNERMTLFLFAAMVQVDRGRGHVRIRPAGSDRLLPHSLILREIYDWLVPQMPQFAFTPEMEDALRSVGRRV